MHKNKKWFSLILAMWLVLIISLLAYTILEYMIPFSRNINWVENSSKAYYQANSWIEEALYKVYERNNSWSIDNKTEFSTGFVSTTSLEFETYSSWSILPPDWEWNSEYDKDWNIIANWLPIQLEVWKNSLSSLLNIEIAFRVPNLDENIAFNDFISTASWSSPVVNWQLSSDSTTLYASWSIITYNDILNSGQWIIDTNIELSDSILFKGEDIDWVEKTFNDFYWANCSWVTDSCILKFSIVNDLITNWGTYFPYLEWKLDLWTNTIPLRYTKIVAWWKANWYKKWLEIKIAGQTVNEAFDFTVFQ